MLSRSIKILIIVKNDLIYVFSGDKKTMNSKSKIIADCGNLSLDISNLICEFLILKSINKKIACSDFVCGGIKDGKVLISKKDHYHSINGKDFISISASGRICATLRSNGTLEILLTCFTSNYFGWDYYSPDDRFINITVVNEDVIGIRSDGSIKSMKKGEIKKKGFIMFANGPLDFYGDVIGLKDDGSIDFLYGKSDSRQLPKGSDYVSISSGWSHILALKTDGSLYSTEFFSIDPDLDGVISNTPKGNNFIAISAHYGISAALTDDETIYVWGCRFNSVKIFSAKDCVDISMSNIIIIGLKSNGDIIIYPLPSTMLDRAPELKCDGDIIIHPLPIARSYDFKSDYY